MANRLIALNKCPGVRPISIGKTAQRILGKRIILATHLDVEEECRVDQLCSGLREGIEGVIHAMRELLDENGNKGWGV